MRKATILCCYLICAGQAGAQPAFLAPRAEGLLIGARGFYAPGFTYDETFCVIPEDPILGESCFVTMPEEAENGFGGGLLIGYGFTPWLTVFGSIDFAEHGSDRYDSIVADYFEAGVRVTAPIESPVRPYATATLGSRGVTLDRFGGSGTPSDPFIVGDTSSEDVFGYTLGIGLQYSILDIGYQLGQADFGSDLETTTDGFSEGSPISNTVTTHRVSVGISIWFDLSK